MDKALTIFRKNNNILGIANVYLTLSEMSLIDGKYQEGIQNLNKALEMYHEQNIKPQISAKYDRLFLAFSDTTRNERHRKYN